MSKLFSAPGAAPTAHERDLFAAQVSPSTDPWVNVGKRIGLEALLVVLDEIGAVERVYVPTRAAMMARLWRPVRNERIVRLAEQQVPPEEIARLLHVSRGSVYRVLGLEAPHAASA
jgi:hypothetical protein